MSDLTATATDTATREGWLRRAADMLKVMVHQVSGIEVPNFHVSIGFGGLSYEKGVRGVCWKRCASADGLNHVFISPELSDTAVVLAVLLHEMLHVATDCHDGTKDPNSSHRGTFAEYGTRLGLCAPFTTATPDEALACELMVIAAELGDFPHGALVVPSRKRVEAPEPITVGGGRVTSGPRQQTNRWVSVTCPAHGGSVRLSRKALDEGAPYCGKRDEAGLPCLTEMIEKV